MNFLKTVAKLFFDPRVSAAFPPLYDYLRWLDDLVDSNEGTKAERQAIVQSQKEHLNRLYQNPENSSSPLSESELVRPVVAVDRRFGRKLKPHLLELLDAMEKDCLRRNKVLGAQALHNVTLLEGRSILEIAQFFSGPDYPYPFREVPAEAIACVMAHNLRDFVEDVEMGHHNISREDTIRYNVDVNNPDREAVRAWAHDTTTEAFELMRLGRHQVSGKQPLRCSLAWNLVCAKYEHILVTIRYSNYDLLTLSPTPTIPNARYIVRNVSQLVRSVSF
jgi:phytoene/squalene synthetase